MVYVYMCPDMFLITPQSDELMISVYYLETYVSWINLYKIHKV